MFNTLMDKMHMGEDDLRFAVALLISAVFAAVLVVVGQKVVYKIAFKRWENPASYQVVSHWEGPATSHGN